MAPKQKKKSLVFYSDSDSDEEEEEEAAPAPPPPKKPCFSLWDRDRRVLTPPPPDSEEEEFQADKKRRISECKAAKAAAAKATPLPPLPANFRDLYSSTVRSSTQDDPSLHGGRKRVTPHVAGNWPAHVYLEWNPDKDQQKLLSDIFRDITGANAKAEAAAIRRFTGEVSKEEEETIHSLLESDLGVQLPLHISLSRPLTLKTENKDAFLSELMEDILRIRMRHFTISPDILTWHPNEDNTRWFLVLSLQRPKNDELRSLLSVCNRTARQFEQPLLYESSERYVKTVAVEDRKFHVSLAWSLVPQEGEVHVATWELHQRLNALRIGIDGVKVRIGQDVTSITLKKQRSSLFQY